MLSAFSSKAGIFDSMGCISAYGMEGTMNTESYKKDLGRI